MNRRHESEGLVGVFRSPSYLNKAVWHVTPRVCGALLGDGNILRVASAGLTRLRRASFGHIPCSARVCKVGNPTKGVIFFNMASRQAVPC